MSPRRGIKWGIAKPVWYDGVKFASKAEGRRYLELRMMLAAGLIRDLQIQPVFPIEVMNPLSGEMVLCATYRADFSYQEGSRFVVEDVKGAQSSDIFRLKRRLVEALHGVRVTEVRSSRRSG